MPQVFASEDMVVLVCVACCLAWGLCFSHRLWVVLQWLQAKSSLPCVHVQQHVLGSLGALSLHCLCAVLCSVWLTIDMLSQQTQMHGTVWAVVLSEFILSMHGCILHCLHALHALP
jgi:hypothetical protein